MRLLQFPSRPERPKSFDCSVREQFSLVVPAFPLRRCKQRHSHHKQLPRSLILQLQYGVCKTSAQQLRYAPKLFILQQMDKLTKLILI